MTLNYGKALAKNQRDPNGAVPVYGANGILDWSDHTLTEGPSLVIGRKGSAGAITRVDGPFWPSDVTYFTSHDEARLSFEFLHYSLLILDLPSMARGVKPGINRNEVYDRHFPLPPLEEQLAIVSSIEKGIQNLSQARSLIQANLDALEELQKSLLQGATTGRIKIIE